MGAVMSEDKKGKRREARERAVQFLFQHEMNPPESLDKTLEEFWQTQRANAHAEKVEGATWGEKQELPPPTTEEAAVQLFADPLIRGVLEHCEKIDAEIQKHAKNWSLQRMAAVDRNVLRLVIYELTRTDTPVSVILDEAIKLARRFGSESSAGFVNGVLVAIAKQVRAPLARTRASDAEVRA